MHSNRVQGQFSIKDENDFHFSAWQQQKHAGDHLAGACVVVANFTPFAAKGTRSKPPRLPRKCIKRAFRTGAKSRFITARTKTACETKNNKRACTHTF